MAVLFQDNFSTLANWLLAGTPTLQPSIFTGKNALFCKPYDYADKQFNPLASVYTEGDFYYDTPLVPGQQVIFLHYQGPNGAEICYISIYVDYVGGPIRLLLYSPFGSQFGSVDIQPNTLVHVGLLYVSGANGGYSAYINGTQVLTASVDTSSQQVNYIYAGMPYSTAATPDVITQDITVSDSYSGTTPPPPTNTLTLQSTEPTTFTVDNQPTPSNQTIPFTPGNHTVSVPPSVTITTSSGGALPLTGIGADYTISSSNGPIDGSANDVWLAPQSWLPSPVTGYSWLQVLAWWKTYGMTVSRIGFVFADSVPPSGLYGESVLDYTKMDTLAGYMNSIGVKMIALLQNNPDSSGVESVSPFSATPKFIADWQTFTAHYMTGTTLGNAFAAFDIFGEPNPYYTLPVYGSLFAEQQRWTDCIAAIHAIDPNRVCIFPFPYYSTYTPQTWYADLQKTSINGHTILQEPNVVFDVLHPYWFPPGSGVQNLTSTPEAEAQYYATNFLIPSISYLGGSSKCWLGETFLWDVYDAQGNLDTVNHALQVRWITAIVSQMVAANSGFSLWNMLVYYSQDLVSAVQAGGYPGSGGSPTTTTYNFDHFELDGTTIGTQNPTTITLAAGQHTLAAVYIQAGPPPPGSYTLQLNSNPPGSIITVDGTTYTTPQTLTLTAGTHTVNAATPINIQSVNYNFVSWQDGTTNPNTTINLVANSSVTANYASTPKTSSKAPLIALTLLGVTAIGAVVIGSNKKGSR